jgi:hypothetical protein
MNAYKTVPVLFMVFLLLSCAISYFPPLIKGTADDGIDPNTLKKYNLEPFDHYIQERFPVGSSEIQLIQELQNEEFTVDIPSQDGQQRSAKYTSGSKILFCQIHAFVLWSADRRGQITKIKGIRQTLCV